jgi:hypothetical protein
MYGVEGNCKIGQRNPTIERYGTLTPIISAPGRNAGGGEDPGTKISNGVKRMSHHVIVCLQSGTMKLQKDWKCMVLPRTTGSVLCRRSEHGIRYYVSWVEICNFVGAIDGTFRQFLGYRKTGCFFL